jgi:hypothetical protein
MTTRPNRVSGGDASRWGDHLDAILAREPLPTDAEPGLHQVSAMLADLADAPPTSSELRGQTEALAAYRAVVGVHARRQRTEPERTPMLQSIRRAPAAAVLAVAATVSLGGVAAAAYTGSLPSVAQGVAHRVLGAPAKPTATPPTTRVPSSGTTATPVGPDATGSAAYGLCTSWTHARLHGTAVEKSVAFANLIKAAGNADNIAAYCANVPQPGAPTTHPGGPPTPLPSRAPTTHPGGKPTSVPTGPPTTHPGGQPTSLPTGSPTTHPTGKPGGSDQ